MSTVQEPQQDQPGVNQDEVAQRTGSVSPPLSPFAISHVQAAADRTEATDGRFSSLQRLSGTASTSRPESGAQQVVCVPTV